MYMYQLLVPVLTRIGVCLRVNKWTFNRLNQVLGLGSMSFVTCFQLSTTDTGTTPICALNTDGTLNCEENQLTLPVMMPSATTTSTLFSWG